MADFNRKNLCKDSPLNEILNYGGGSKTKKNRRAKVSGVDLEIDEDRVIYEMDELQSDPNSPLKISKDKIISRLTT